MKNKKKFNLKGKAPLIIGSAVIAAGLLGGGYYFYNQKQVSKDAGVITTTPTTDAQVQQNVTEKSGATTGSTTTPAVVAEKAATVSLKDVSLSVLQSENTADVILYGPSGTYAVEKLTGSSWVVIQQSFENTSRDPRRIDTITSATAETHYRISLIQNGKRVATSGDTVIVWQQLLNNGGTLSVPLAE